MAATGQPLPPASADWLVRAIDRMLEGDDPRAVLGLNNAAAMRERDRLLRQGAAELEGNRTQRAEAMAKLVKKYQSGRQAPAWLIEANRLKKIPTTSRRLFDIIR
jgi:uncharacterized protein YfaQ (DUF2300 family)